MKSVTLASNQPELRAYIDIDEESGLYYISVWSFPDGETVQLLQTDPKYATAHSARQRCYNLKRKLKGLSRDDLLEVIKSLNDTAGPKPSGAMVSVHLRMPAALHEEYKAQAAKAGMCVSEYYRAVLFGAEADDAQ